MNYYYKELPAGYHAVKEIDAVGNKKFAVGMNLAALPLMLVSGAAAWLLRFSGERLVLDNPMSLGAAWMAFCAGILVYLVLHELMHGIVYHLMTGEKLHFGLSWCFPPCSSRSSVYATGWPLRRRFCFSRCISAAAPATYTTRFCCCSASEATF